MILGGVRRRLARADVMIASVLLGIAAVFVGLHVHGYTTLSPVDELQHIDYLYRAPAHPEPDDKVGQDALHQQLCRGIDAEGFGPPRCQPGYLDPGVFQEGGYNTAAGYTPLYYSVTRLGAETLGLVSPVDDLVTAGRLMGALWLGLGLLMTYSAGRMRGIGRGPLAATCLLVLSAPAVIYPSSTIAPDASAIAVGGGLLLGLTLWERRPSKRSAAVLVVLAALAALVKMTYLCVVAAISLYLLLRWARTLRRPGPAARRSLVLGVGAGAGALVASFGWSAYVASLPQIATADLPTMATQFRVTAFPWAGLSDSLFVLVQPLGNPWVLVGNVQLTVLSSTLVSLTLTGGVIAAGVFGGAEERERDLARATLIAAVLTGAGLVVLAYVTAGSYIPLPTRYGMALVAPMMLSAAACAKSRTAGVLLSGLAAVSVLLAVWRLVWLN